MKLRAGFVSNSSTSSFVLFGFALDKDQFMDVAKHLLGEDEVSDIEVGEEWPEDVPWAIESSIRDNTPFVVRQHEAAPTGKILVGVEPLDVDEYGISRAEVDLDDIMTKMKELGAVLGTDAKFKMYAGTYAC